MENEIDYVPYGPEWERELMKWRKKDLIDWLRDHMMMRESNQKFLREAIMRANLALPESEEDLKWFDEGINVDRDHKFIERVFHIAGLGKLQIGQRKQLITISDLLQSARDED